MNHRDKTTVGTPYSSLQMVRERENGAIFQEDTLTSNYYKHIKIARTWAQDKGSADHGSIFNIEFSPTGKLMVAACEKEAILIFDPLSRILISKIQPSHNDCVNCICFLDERTFASGSDDHTIALWDARMLHDCVTKLVGHTSWVKSLVYNKNTAQLVTSGYDGTVRLWDINTYSDNATQSKVIYNGDNLSRMQLTPAGDKLIISTFSGTITVFHNLNFDTLLEDINNQRLQNHLLSRWNHHISFPVDRNYPEYIVDFPHKPWYISSLQVHPFGWCLMSRYTSSNLNIEYTAVHDIQSIPNDKSTQGKTTNVKRLSHYIEESNAAKGIIKEQDFSKDGRIIASPFGHGTRLLAFGADCCELCQCDHDRPVTTELYEIKYLISHQHAVCTSKFSPTHTLLATGCLGGKIAFHEPTF